MLRLACSAIRLCVALPFDSGFTHCILTHEYKSNVRLGASIPGVDCYCWGQARPTDLDISNIFAVRRPIVAAIVIGWVKGGGIF